MKKIFVTGSLAIAMTLGLASTAAAHCDALDGPVVTAARTALQSGDVTPVLRWVTSAQEAEVRAAFADAAAVRQAGSRAQGLADRYFFETVVRLHRLSEGEPYTGLKPAGGIDEHIAAADRSIETGSVDPLAAALSEKVVGELRSRFEQVKARKGHAGDSVEAGREYVKAYVAFIHYAEEVGALAGGTAAHSR